jgi:putative PIN family toxin of toxin-antitoxin system
MKLILDTNIYLSVIIFNSKLEDFYKNLLIEKDLEFYFSTATFTELKEKTQDSKFLHLLSKNRCLETSYISDYLENIAEISVFQEANYKLNICRDPKDNMFLELAKTVAADYLITGDKDLLVLNQFETIKILKPSEFSQVLNLQF